MSQGLKIDDEFLSLEGAANEFGIEWSGSPEVSRSEVIAPDGVVSAVRWGGAPVAVLLHGRAPASAHAHGTRLLWTGGCRCWPSIPPDTDSRRSGRTVGTHRD